MQVKTEQICWHGKETQIFPVFSVDFHSSNNRLATGGGENTVRIWKIQNGNVEFRATLSQHTKTINIVRFSPDGEKLASGSDDGSILIWKLISEEPQDQSLLSEGEIPNKETWKAVTKITGQADVFDLAWSPNSEYIISGSTDYTAKIWHITNAKIPWETLSDHASYVQGVCWDPTNQLICTQSFDRTLRMYNLPSTSKPKRGGLKSKLVVSQRTVVSGTEGIANFKHKLFLGEGYTSFFRRLEWSPDGSLLVVPAGMYQASPEDTVQNTTYVFTKHFLNTPAMHLPTQGSASVLVRWSKKKYKLVENNKLFELDYKMVFAVGCLDCILIYDTEHVVPLYRVAGIHYAPLTDLSWSADGQCLVVSSKDGYCTFLSFPPDQFGEEY
eukprot:TRINITY_DN3726_c0_g1_i1.p1 TRINITY_DN3726_c0_g1~~TRINITY_DN3726_c0_g1_i1.p1  ORF type:complete len:385 (-),score=69.18 TRINITY_DN3726_c0_g1_i1:32-1186(-)